MAIQLTNGYKNISPIVGEPDNPAANNLGANFSDWESEWYACEGTPNHGLYQSTEVVNLRFRYNFDGATSIEIIVDMADVNERANPAVASLRDASGQSLPDTLTLTPGNLIDPTQGSVDHQFQVKGAAHIRFRARAVGGTTPTLEAFISAG